jgi:hypothetical protein
MSEPIQLVRSSIVAWFSSSSSSASTKDSYHPLHVTRRKMKALLDERLNPIGSSSPTVLYIESRETFQQLFFSGGAWNDEMVDLAMRLYQRVLLELSMEQNEVQKRWILDPQLLQQILNNWKQTIQQQKKNNRQSIETLQRLNITPTQIVNRLLQFQTILPEFRFDGASLGTIFDVVQILHHHTPDSTSAVAIANTMHAIMDRCSCTVNENAAIRRDLSIYKRLLQAWSQTTVTTTNNSIYTTSEAPARIENILSRMIISERIRPDDECWNIVQEYIDKTWTEKENGKEDNIPEYGAFLQRIQELKKQASNMIEEKVVTSPATAAAAAVPAPVKLKSDALPTTNQRIQSLQALIVQLQNQMKDLFTRQNDILKNADAKIEELQRRQRQLEERMGLTTHIHGRNNHNMETEIINGYNPKNFESQRQGQDNHIHPIESATVLQRPADTEFVVSSTEPVVDRIPDTNPDMIVVSADGTTVEKDTPDDESQFTKIESSKIITSDVKTSIDLTAYVLPKKPAVIDPKTGRYRRPAGRTPSNVGEWDAQVGAWTQKIHSKS